MSEVSERLHGITATPIRRSELTGRYVVELDADDFTYLLNVAGPEVIKEFNEDTMTAALCRVYGHTSQCVRVWEEYDVTMAAVAQSMTSEDWANLRHPVQCKGECRRQDALTLLSQLP